MMRLICFHFCCFLLHCPINLVHFHSLFSFLHQHVWRWYSSFFLKFLLHELLGSTGFQIFFYSNKKTACAYLEIYLEISLSHIYSYIHIFTYSYIHIHIHIFIYILIYTYSYTYTYIHIHIHTHIYIFIYIHIYTHIYIYK